MKWNKFKFLFIFFIPIFQYFLLIHSLFFFENMSFCDIRGETIDVGSFIRYTGTGTISKVVDLKEEDNEQWVKLDEPALWYAADSLEVVNEKDIVDIESVDKDTLKQVKDIKEGYEELNANLNDIQGCEGGG